GPPPRRFARLSVPDETARAQLGKTGKRISATNVAFAAAPAGAGTVWNPRAVSGDSVVQELIQTRTSTRPVRGNCSAFVSTLGIDRFVGIWFGPGNGWACCRLANSAWWIASHFKRARQLSG